MNYRLPAALLSLALLASCGEEPVAEPADNDGRTAEGEVIGGTISDAMLPLDTIRSQAPPMTMTPPGGAQPGAAASPAPAEQAGPAARGDAAEAQDEGAEDAN